MVVVPAATPVAWPLLILVLVMEAILVEEDDQFASVVTFCMMPPGKLPVAVNCCVAPTEMVAFVGVIMIELMLDAVPTPLSVAVCGLLLALSVTVNFPVLGLVLVLNWVGENFTAIVQLPLAGTILKQLLPDTAKSPLAVAEKLRVVLRLLVRVMLCGFDVVPT